MCRHVGGGSSAKYQKKKTPPKLSATDACSSCAPFVRAPRGVTLSARLFLDLEWETGVVLVLLQIGDGRQSWWRSLCVVAPRLFNQHRPSPGGGGGDGGGVPRRTRLSPVVQKLLKDL